jgi:hypothetical protein
MSEQKIFLYLLNVIVGTVERRYYVPTPVGRRERRILFSFQGILPVIEVYVQERFRLTLQLQGSL